MPKKPKLGTGKRFQSLVSSLTKENKVKDPAALAASIGRKKFGAKKMATMSKNSRGKTGHKRSY